MSKLFEDSDSEVEADIKTDNAYAKNYENWRQKEELNKLKTKYGEEILEQSDESTSSSEDEDDEAVQITEELEKDFFKTLASLKNKDPKIYDQNTSFFTEATDISIKKPKRNQPMYIKDYERELLLKNDGKVDDSDDKASESKSLTYVEEHKKLKQNLKDALETVDDDSDDEWGGMFRSRNKTDAELKAEEEDYKQWLKGQKEDIDDEIKNDLKPLKDYWNDPELDQNEKFLRDYILNKRFMEPEDKEYVPTYEEIIHDSDQDLSEDDKQIEKQEEFEHKYNYRFEEPDEEFIKRYPRTIENSLRRQDNKRKIKRIEVKERKQKEKQKKMEEIKQMHALKKKEIEEKIQKLKEVTGNTDVPFDDCDIEGDFDPEAHDRRMQRLFNDEFYQGDEEEQKPQFPDLDEELEIENWDKYESQQNDTNTENELHCEDEDFNMDCDYNPTVNKMSEVSGRKKRRKRKSKFAEVLSDPKPTFNPEDKTYEEYLDEYYKLECEDIIGDIPCRFKYRKVIPNSFGLTIEETLMANDRELNKWCSLKKAIQYRQENVEKYDVIAFERKGRNESLKRKLLPSLFKEENTNLTKENSENVKRSKKDNKKKIYTSTTENNNEENEINNVVNHPGEINSSETNKASSSLSSTNVSESIDYKDSIHISKDVVTKKKKKLKKIKASLTSTNTSKETKSHDESKVTSNDEKQNKNHKRKSKNHNIESVNKMSKNRFSKQNNLNEIDISDARLRAFGIKPKKFKNKIKYGQKQK